MFPNHHIKEWLTTAEYPEAQQFILDYHYLPSLPRGTKRMYTFHWQGKLMGVATFGSPVGKGYGSEVIELKRFVLAPGLPTNSASWFLSRCLQMLKGGPYTHVLSYADPGMGHKGIIYKAANFQYKGVQKYRTPIFQLGDVKVYARNINNERNKEIKQALKAGKIKTTYLPAKHVFIKEL